MSFTPIPLPQRVSRTRKSHSTRQSSQVLERMLETTHTLDHRAETRSPRGQGLPQGEVRDVDLERANGAGRIVLAGEGTGARIADIYQKFPIRLLLPKVDDHPYREVVIINSSGGIAGGDRLEIEVVALNRASVSVTTQAAEKIYRALDRPARILTKLKASESAKLAWLPQETIVFDGARIARQTEIDLCSGAEIIALEWLVLGRIESGEEVRGGYILDSWRIKLDGRLVWVDGFFVADETFAHLHRKALLSRWKAIGTLIYFGPRLDARLETLREIAASLDCQCAATIVGAIIIVRVAAAASADLKRGLRSLLDRFSLELVPGPFGVPKMWSC
jgi:urease accessory protein